MAKKKFYVKPEIKEESRILTVKAMITAVTNTSVLVQEATTTTSVAIQNTSVATQERLAASLARVAARK